MNREPDPLRAALHERAEALHDAPVTLDDVRARASGIRRSRRLATGVGVLAALAVLAPVGVVALGGDDEAGTPTASDGAAPADPGPVGRVDFTGQGLGRGAATGLPYVAPGQDVVAPGRRVSARGIASPQDAAVVDGGAVVAGDDGTGRARVSVLEADGDVRVAASAPVADPIASSDELGQVAWTQGVGADQQVVVARSGSLQQVDAARYTDLPSGGDGTAWRPAGIGPEGVVLEDEAGAETSVVVAGPDGVVRQVPGLVAAAGVDPVSGRIAGVTARGADSSCSAVVDPDGAAAWETCDYTLLDFSPDGRWVLATVPFRSGFGDTTTAVLDARTGELQVEWRASDPESSATWISRRWEDDDSFVAVLVVGNEVSLTRFGVDGSAEHAADPVTVDDPAVDMPYVLPQD